MASQQPITNRVIQKQGYLKKLPNKDSLAATFRRADKRWFVFGVFNGHEPYLEYYNSQSEIFTGNPIRFISLLTCHHIMPGLIGGRNGYLFTIVTSVRELNLLAQSREDMHEWCTSIENCLKELKILQTAENPYVVENHLNQSSGRRVSAPAVVISSPSAASPRRSVPDISQTGPTLYDVPPRRLPPPPPEGVYQSPSEGVYQAPSSLPINLNSEITREQDPVEDSDSLPLYSAPSRPPHPVPSPSVNNSSPPSIYSAPSSLPIAISLPPAVEADSSLLIGTIAEEEEDSSEQPSIYSSPPLYTAAIQPTRTMATAHPHARQRLDLNFHPGATVVDMVETRNDNVFDDDEGEVYEPLWNKNKQDDDASIPVLPPPLRKKDVKRSMSVPNNASDIPNRRASRSLSLVSGQGRPAGREPLLEDEEVISGARMPGQPARDASIRVPVAGLPDDDDIPTENAPPVPSLRTRSMSADAASGVPNLPPRTPRTVQQVLNPTYQSPATPGTPSTPQTPTTPHTPSTPRTPNMPQTPSTPNTPNTPLSPLTPMSQFNPPAYTPQRERSMSTVAGPPTPLSPLVSPVYPQTPSGRSLSVGAIYLSPTATPPEVCPDDPGPFSVLPPKMQEAMEDAVGGWNVPPPDEGAPPPYMARSVLNRGAHKSLKQSQIALLQKEMDHPGGVKVTLRRIDCHHTLALVECFGAVWIAGWNQQARPYLHNAFHVGDQIVSINFQVVENTRMAYKLIKHSGADDKIVFIVKRVPNARVLAVRRETEGQELGLRRQGGTGEVLEVEPFSLLARNGLPSKAPSMDNTNLCLWWITEINHRPVSLFYKGDEIERRLNAVGLDISLMVLPSQLIAEFRRQLKLIKNYKDFIVQ